MSKGHIEVTRAGWQSALVQNSDLNHNPLC